MYLVLVAIPLLIIVLKCYFDSDSIAYNIATTIDIDIVIVIVIAIYYQSCKNIIQQSSSLLEDNFGIPIFVTKFDLNVSSYFPYESYTKVIFLIFSELVHKCMNENKSYFRTFSNKPWNK